MKKPTTPNNQGDAFKFVMPGEASLEDKLLNIYWYKKELEEFLPQIATYATPQEISGITISQLAIIEKQVVAILYDLAKKQSD